MSKIIGIDLGTSNSAASVMEAGKAVIIPAAEGASSVDLIELKPAERSRVWSRSTNRRRSHTRASNTGVAEGQNARSSDYRQSTRLTRTEVARITPRHTGGAERPRCEGGVMTRKTPPLSATGRVGRGSGPCN